MEDELLDVVDITDTVVSTCMRSVENSGKLSKDRKIRVVNIFVLNKEGKVLVPLRSADRRIFPNCYDFSCGEHVMSGESYDAAAKRGLKEELGLDVEPQFLAKLTPAHGVSNMMQVYVAFADGPFDYDKKGITSLNWMTVKDFKDITVNQPQKCKGDIAQTLKYVTLPDNNIKRVFTQTFGVVGAIVEKDGKILLVKESKRKGPAAGKWNQPAGWIDVGEDPLVAVKREVEEETGYAFTPTHLLGVYSLSKEMKNDAPGEYAHGIKLIYTGTLSVKATRQLESDVVEVKGFTLSEIKNLGPLLRDLDIITEVEDYYAGKRFPLSTVKHTVQN